MAQIKYIKDLYENEESGLRGIFRIIGHDFRIVRKYAYREAWNDTTIPKMESQHFPVMDIYSNKTRLWGRNALSVS